MTQAHPETYNTQYFYLPRHLLISSEELRRFPNDCRDKSNRGPLKKHKLTSKHSLSEAIFSIRQQDENRKGGHFLRMDCHTRVLNGVLKAMI